MNRMPGLIASGCMGNRCQTAISESVLSTTRPIYILYRTLVPQTNRLLRLWNTMVIDRTNNFRWRGLFRVLSGEWDRKFSQLCYVSFSRVSPFVVLGAITNFTGHSPWTRDTNCIRRHRVLRTYTSWSGSHEDHDPRSFQSVSPGVPSRPMRCWLGLGRRTDCT